MTTMLSIYWSTTSKCVKDTQLLFILKGEVELDEEWMIQVWHDVSFSLNVLRFVLLHYVALFQDLNCWNTCTNPFQYMLTPRSLSTLILMNRMHMNQSDDIMTYLHIPSPSSVPLLRQPASSKLQRLIHYKNNTIWHLKSECACRTVEKEPSPNILPNRKSSGLFLRGWVGWGGSACPSMLLPWRRGVSCWPLTMDGQEMRTEEWRDATSYWWEKETKSLYYSLYWTTASDVIIAWLLIVFWQIAHDV